MFIENRNFWTRVHEPPAFKPDWRRCCSLVVLLLTFRQVVKKSSRWAHKEIVHVRKSSALLEWWRCNSNLQMGVHCNRDYDPWVVSVHRWYNGTNCLTRIRVHRLSWEVKYNHFEISQHNYNWYECSWSVPGFLVTQLYNVSRCSRLSFTSLLDFDCHPCANLTFNLFDFLYWMKFKE